MTEGALSDLRVVELAQGIAGPYCGKLFADTGAEVIKVEPPEGDRSRRLGPFPEDLPHHEKSGLFLHLNTGKKSVTLDVSVTSGQVVLRKLLERADILIESEGVSTMAGWELSHDDLKDDLPSLVYVSVTPFGCTGPYKDYAGNTLTAMAMSTIMYNTGEPDREPLATGGNIAEFMAGIHAWVGAIAAVEYRAREGRSQHVDVSLAEAVACADEYNSAMYAYQGAIRRRYYSRHIFGYPSDIFPCKDGYIVMVPGAGGFPIPGVTEEGGVSPMSLLLENPELDQHPLFMANRERMLRSQEFDDLVLPWLREHTAKEIVETAQVFRMPFALVPTAHDLLDDEHLRERGFFQVMEHPQAGDLTHAGPPFRMSETPISMERAPLLAEDNEEALGELGYSLEEQMILRERGVT